MHPRGKICTTRCAVVCCSTNVLLKGVWSGHSSHSLPDPAHHNTSITTMKLDITEGTYVNKKDKDFVDYLVKCGMYYVGLINL